jgi:hypothetical protein
MPAPTKVLTSLENPAGDRCVDVFVRTDGTFGFEEHRRDAEDCGGWFPLHRYSHLVFSTAEGALAQAKSKVEWMVEANGGHVSESDSGGRGRRSQGDPK